MVTIFLATVLGWLFIIMSFFLLFRHQYMKSVMTDIMGHPGLFFVFAWVALLFGLLMVTSHNIWVMGWPVIITLFGWLLLFSGLIRLVCSDVAIKMGQSFFNHPIRMRATGGVLLIIGLFLLSRAYYFHA